MPVNRMTPPLTLHPEDLLSREMVTGSPEEDEAVGVYVTVVEDTKAGGVEEKETVCDC